MWKYHLFVLLLIVVATISGNDPSPSSSVDPQSSRCNSTPLPNIAPPMPPTDKVYADKARHAVKLFSKKQHSSKNVNMSTEAGIIKNILTEDIFLMTIRSQEHPQLFVYRRKEMLHMNKSKLPDYDPYWRAVEFVMNRTGKGWSPPFRDCSFNKGVWHHGYIASDSKSGVVIGFFVPLDLNQCDANLADIFGGKHKCDEESTECKPVFSQGMKRGGYKCICKDRFYVPSVNTTWNGFDGIDVENGSLDARCTECPSACETCDRRGRCLEHPNVLLRTVVLSIQLMCMFNTILVAILVFRQRKCKTIASGMWTVLETILLGILLLYFTVIIRYFDVSVERCLLEPWARELGFVICYGAIVLKMYRHLIDFRTRKAHRWIVKDTDLLKYLLVMTMAVLAYMAAYTATNLNFIQENFSILSEQQNDDGFHFVMCKPLWWDYVTQIGEITILIFGVHLSYASRNAATQFQERNFLCASISVELAVSGIFYILRAMYFTRIQPDYEFFAYFIRSQLTSSVVLLLVFSPKFWYQQKQSRSLAQEFSCRIPVDAFKPDVACNTHSAVVPNNSDVDVSEVSLAEMSPDDIRAELKRLYTQLEVLKNKTLRANNPHISKRRGGRKVAHRRFSLQKKGSREKVHGKQHRKHHDLEATEGEVSRTPEDSVCSGEGPSAIYNDLASTYSELIGPPNAAAICKPQQSSASK